MVRDPKKLIGIYNMQHAGNFFLYILLNCEQSLISNIL
jgi:hypothetical protein